MSCWPPMRRLSSTRDTPRRDSHAVRRLCSSGEAQYLLIRSERVTQMISRVFLDRLGSDGLEPPFFGWRNKAGTRLRRWGCYLGPLGEYGYSPLVATSIRTHAL